MSFLDEVSQRWMRLGVRERRMLVLLVLTLVFGVFGTVGLIIARGLGTIGDRNEEMRLALELIEERRDDYLDQQSRQSQSAVAMINATPPALPSYLEEVAKEVGVTIPAHLDEATGEYLLEYDLPCEFDAEAKRWLFDQPITWDRVWERWRARGPMNERYTEMIQGRGNGQFRASASTNGVH